MTQELEQAGHGGDCACNACNKTGDELDLNGPTSAVFTSDLKAMPMQEEATLDKAPVR
ncbi:MAG: hypothetical protein MRY32_01385 [Rickettsiales bacterium]|nr:hypothetical protein [Rickettsiales bacterium]